MTLTTARRTMVVLVITSALAHRPAQALPSWAQRAKVTVQNGWGRLTARIAERRAMRVKAQEQLDLFRLGKLELKELNQRGVSYDRNRGGVFKFHKDASKHWIDVGDDVKLSRDGKYRYHGARSVNGGQVPAFMEIVGTPGAAVRPEPGPRTLEAAADRIGAAQGTTAGTTRALRLPRIERELQAAKLLSSGVNTSAVASQRMGVSRRHAQRVMGGVARYDSKERIWVARPLPSERRVQQITTLLGRGVNRSASIASELGISQSQAARLLGRVASYDRKQRIWVLNDKPAEQGRPVEPAHPTATPPSQEPLLDAVRAVLKASSTPLGGKKIVATLKANGIEASEKSVQRAVRALQAKQVKQGPVSGWVLPADPAANP